ncbi:MAG: cytochrome c maturation protein CcmE [Burkholderiaceae bacterium]|nr:MAG: cytochrome c maturation protein CcmE [Burkholderiaceae bacterium]
MYVVIAVLVAGLIAGALVVKALSSNLAYLYTPAEVRAGQAGERAVFRLGGMVKEGSIERIADTLESRFTVSDGDAELVVSYTGILPDLFRDNQSVIATGSMQGDRFVATELLAKHDETYMPRELADKMEAAHTKQNVPDAGAVSDAP